MKISRLTRPSRLEFGIRTISKTPERLVPVHATSFNGNIYNEAMDDWTYCLSTNLGRGFGAIQEKILCRFGGAAVHIMRHLMSDLEDLQKLDRDLTVQC